MAIKGYSTFPKSPTLLEPLHQIVLRHILATRCGSGEGSYPSAEKQSEYSTAPADGANSWSYLSICKQMINTKYLETLYFVQMY